MSYLKGKLQWNDGTFFYLNLHWTAFTDCCRRRIFYGLINIIAETVWLDVLVAPLRNPMLFWWGSHQTIWSLPLPHVTWHYGAWQYTVTPSTDLTFHHLLTELDLITLYILWPKSRMVSIEHLQRLRLVNRGRLLLRTPGPVPFETCIFSNVETILSWTCHTSDFEFRTSLSTSILVFRYILPWMPCRHLNPLNRDSGN